MLGYGARLVVRKRGHEGYVVFTSQGRVDREGHALAELDPIGAGDCFCGTLLALLEQGRTPVKTAAFANAAGAIAVTRRGPMEGNSSHREIERFLKNG